MTWHLFHLGFSKPELSIHVLLSQGCCAAVGMPVLLIIFLLMEVWAENTGTCTALKGGIRVFVSLQMRDFAQTPPFWNTVVSKCLHLDNRALIVVWWNSRLWKCHVSHFQDEGFTDLQKSLWMRTIMFCTSENWTTDFILLQKAEISQNCTVQLRPDCIY